VRVAVLGAGAVGGFVGAKLSRRAEVVLIGRGRHLASIRRSGLRIEGLSARPFRLEATADVGAAADADLIILTTKAYDTAPAARQLREVRVRCPLLSLQNGLTNLSVLRRTLPSNALLGGSIVLGVTRVGAGRLRYAGGGRAVLGGATDGAALARRTAALLTQAGIPTRTTQDLDGVLWAKAVVNAAVNPLTAVLGCTNGEILVRLEARLVARLAAQEATSVALAHGVRVARDPWPAVARVLKDTASNRSSMLQDVEAGRPTEIDAITGEIVRVGARRRVPTPVNRGLLALVKSL